MLKIVLGIFFVIVVALFVYAQVAWKGEMQDWPRPEDRDPKDDDNYCADMDQV